ncbi:hypothetical protein [Rhodococcus erythropolis]|uniref:hypothetical protein n=1 Tax=Rhodococcus erythropolis TaxID=1833 RepID=UPI00366FA6DA
MSEQKTVLEHLARRRLTAVEIGEILDVTEKTARKRLSDGLNASDVIAICRAIGVNPVDALVELKFVTVEEAMNFVDSDGQLLATADQEALILELVDRSLSTPQLADLLAARSRRPDVTISLTEGMSRAEVEKQLAKAQALGLIPAADNVYPLTSLGQAHRVADVDVQALIESDEPYAANTSSEPLPEDDHGWDA